MSGFCNKGAQAMPINAALAEAAGTSLEMHFSFNYKEIPTLKRVGFKTE